MVLRRQSPSVQKRPPVEEMNSSREFRTKNLKPSLSRCLARCFFPPKLNSLIHRIALSRVMEEYEYLQFA